MRMRSDPRGVCSPGEERQLTLRTRAGDPAAREEFILRNTGLVNKVLRRLAADLGDEDLFSEGIIGLIEAVDGFDPAKGLKFSSYAGRCIRGVLLNALNDRAMVKTDGDAIRLAATEDLTDREPQNVGRAMRAAAACRQARTPMRSLSVVPRGESDRRMLDPADRNAADPSDRIIDAETRTRLLAAMEALLPIHSHILWRRAGINGAKETLVEIGASLGLSRGRIHQIELAAYAELSKKLGISCAAGNVA